MTAWKLTTNLRGPKGDKGDRGPAGPSGGGGFSSGGGSGALLGTGSPEGAITAEPGVMYVDLDKTNGAEVWVKSSGSDTTGWTVLKGDTGWRDVTANASVSQGQVFIRRTATQAIVRAKNIITIGEGDLCSWTIEDFASQLYQGEVIGMTRNAYGAVGQMWSGWTRLRFSSSSPTDPFNITCSTPDVAPGWPAVLPGTPA